MRTGDGVGTSAFFSLLTNPLTRSMTLLLLEALGALVLLVFIVWWTMFSGRKNGELPDSATGPEPEKKSPKASASDTRAPD